MSPLRSMYATTEEEALKTFQEYGINNKFHLMRSHGTIE